MIGWDDVVEGILHCFELRMRTFLWLIICVVAVIGLHCVPVSLPVQIGLDVIFLSLFSYVWFARIPWPD